MPSLQPEEQRLESPEKLLFGEIAAGIYCGKQLLSDVTLRISFARSKPEFALIYDGDDKNYQITLCQANLCVRKMTVSDQIFTAVENARPKTPALDRYTANLPETYLIAQQISKLEQRFPIRPFLVPN